MRVHWFSFISRPHGLRMNVPYVRANKARLEAKAVSVRSWLNDASDVALVWQRCQRALRAAGGAGNRERGFNLPKVCKRAAAARGRQLSANIRHQRKAAVAGVRKRKRPATPEVVQARQPQEDELRSLRWYIKKRSAKHAGNPASFKKRLTVECVAALVLKYFHFCENNRERDPTSKAFVKAMGNVHDVVQIMGSCIMLALLPSWETYCVIMTAMFSGWVFQQRFSEATKSSDLVSKLERKVASTTGTIWQDFPYITLARQGQPKLRYIVRIAMKLQKKLPQLLNAMLAFAQGSHSMYQVSHYCWEQLKTLDGVGSFVAYQALVSFSYVQHHAGVHLYDGNAHTVTGNGTNKALRRLFPKMRLGGPGASDSQQAAVARIRDVVLPKASLQASEHVLCEWVKHRCGVIFLCRLLKVPLPDSIAHEAGQLPRRVRRRYRGRLPDWKMLQSN